MMLMTPSTALAPHNVAPGPRITSIRSRSSSITSWIFQYTPENKGVYTLLPSMRTSSLLSKRPLNPREPIAHLFSSMRATSRPGTRRSASGMLVAPDRRMSSCVITKIAAAASATCCLRLETEVTCIFHRSSKLTAVTSGTLRDVWATVLPARTPARKPAKRIRPALRTGPLLLLRWNSIFSFPSRRWSARLARDPQSGTLPYTLNPSPSCCSRRGSFLRFIYSPQRAKPVYRIRLLALFRTWPRATPHVLRQRSSSTPQKRARQLLQKSVCRQSMNLFLGSACVLGLLSRQSSYRLCSCYREHRRICKCVGSAEIVKKRSYLLFGFAFAAEHPCQLGSCNLQL